MTLIREKDLRKTTAEGDSPQQAKTGRVGDPGGCHTRVAGTATRKIEGLARSK